MQIENLNDSETNDVVRYLDRIDQELSGHQKINNNFMKILEQQRSSIRNVYILIIAVCAVQVAHLWVSH